jgi:hypothetical protein
MFAREKNMERRALENTSVATVITWRPFAPGESRGVETPKAEKTYGGFWYSFHLLIPIVGLGLVDAWVPKGRARQRYARFHKITGNLLLPIGLAAWTGIIK